MKKESQHFVSAIFSLIFPISTFIVLQLIISQLQTPAGEGGNLGLIVAIPLLFVLFIGLGSVFAFILGIQVIRATKELSSYKSLVLTLAIIGVLSGIAEIGYFLWFLNFF